MTYDMHAIMEAIKAEVYKHPYDIKKYEDWHSCIMSLCRQTDRKDNPEYEYAHKENRKLLTMAADMMQRSRALEQKGKFYDMYRKALRFDAVDRFDSYLIYIELDRKAKDRFYMPRRHYLYRYVCAYQRILDGQLDFLSVSMPKRSGKSQLGINFICMLSGLYPNKSTLMEGAGDALVNSFYKGVLEYLQETDKYLFKDIFPNAPIVETNADIKIVNLVHKSRFPTVMCRSIDSSQVGLSEATNALYLDDTVEGRMEAKNRSRLDSKWETISGDILGRAIEGTPIISCGTRYSLYDPMGRLIDAMRKQGKRIEVIETPALDPVTDESNFEYIRDGKKVFTTEYFRHQREMLSAEQFESEFQQQPFEAKGLLFPSKELNRFMELPVDTEPDAIVAACDTAEKGSDFCSMPIIAIYGEDCYLIDAVYDDSPANVTKPECAKALIDNNVTEAVFESNGAGEYFGRDVGLILKDEKYICNIKIKRTVTNKQTRIEFSADNVLKHFYFKDESLYKPSSQYGQFMRNLTTYTRSGKVPHDDAPDSISLLENEIRTRTAGNVEIFKRTF